MTWRDNSLWWRSRRGDVVPLHGLKVIRADLVGGGRMAAAGSVVVHAATGTGIAVDLVTHHAFQTTLRELLDRGSQLDPPEVVNMKSSGWGWVAAIRRVMPVWAVLCAALGVVWMAFWAWNFAVGDRVQAEVVTIEDEMCTVEWVDPEGRQVADVDCGSELRTGDTMEVLAFPWPLTGEAVAPGLTSVIAVVVGLLLFAPAVLTTVLQRRRPADRDVRTDIGPSVVVPFIDPAELSFESAAHAMSLRAILERWPAVTPEPLADDDDLVPRHWWEVRALRRTALGALAHACAPLVITSVAVLLGAGWWITSVSMSFGDVASTDATVIDVIPGEVPLLPDDVKVRYLVAGRPVVAHVAASREVAVGDTERVTYDVEHPERARLSSGDGMRLGANLTVVLALITSVMAWVRIQRVRDGLKSVVDAARRPGVEMPYVLFVDGGGELTALLFQGVGRGQELYAVPLAQDVRDRVPVAGLATVRGELPNEVGSLVPQTNGRILWPSMYAMKLSPEDAAAALNGDFLGEDAP